MRRDRGSNGASRLAAIVTGLALASLVACENAGSGRSVGLDATGVVRGFVYFDENGSGGPEAEDRPVAGARIRLLTPGSRDTVHRATTGPDGRFRIAGVPIGSYVVVLDSASGGDSVSVVRIDAPAITVLPDDSAEVTGTFGFAERTATEVRTLPLGTHVFVTGVALHARTTFSDSLLHVVDTSGAIRAVRVRPASASALAGDSVRVRGIVSMRSGQRALDEVSVFVVAPTFIPPATEMTTGVASGAAGGAADAALVRVVGATVADTATVDGHVTMTVNDGSGALTVRLDRAADAGFRPPLPANLYEAGNTFDIVGVLVPTGVGTWVLRPRTSLDLTLR